jgi:hypothetical protein
MPGSVILAKTDGSQVIAYKDLYLSNNDHPDQRRASWIARGIP